MSEPTWERVLRDLAAFSSFSSTSLDELLAPPSRDELTRRALDLFASVVDAVPAYRAFLTEHGVDPAQVRDLTGFTALPLLTKENYLRRYRLAQLCGVVSCRAAT